jgi:sorting nexin-3/12
MAQKAGDGSIRPDTKRLEFKKQNLDDAYAVPANVLEIDVINPETKGIGKKRYTDYEVRMRVSGWCVQFKQHRIPLIIFAV